MLYKLKHLIKDNGDHIDLFAYFSKAPQSETIFDLIVSEITAYSSITSEDDMVLAAQNYLTALNETIVCHFSINPTLDSEQND
jgi:hypothetical protein